MADYTSSEIEAAVESLIKGASSTPRTSAGVVDANEDFNTAVDMISDAMVSDPDSILYIVYLATNRLNTDVEEALEYLADIQTAIGEMSKSTSPIDDVSKLSTAHTSLISMETSLDAGTGNPSASYSRYRSAVDSFASSALSPNIVSSGSIVRPPHQAKLEMRTSLSDLIEAYEDILDNWEQLKGAVTEFLAVGLDDRLLKSSVALVRNQMSSLIDSMNALTADQRVAVAREAYLTMIAG